MILTRRLCTFVAALPNGVLMRRLAISAPVATTSVSAAAISASIASTAARAVAGAAKSARIAATAAAAALTLSLVLPLPREGVCANISKRRFHRIGLRASG